MINITAIKGSGNSLDRAEEVINAIKDAVYETADGMSFAAVIGCIEIAKLEILRGTKA